MKLIKVQISFLIKKEVDYFVANQPEIEELYNLAPVIKSLRQNADLLNAFFIDNEKANIKES